MGISMGKNPVSMSIFDRQSQRLTDSIDGLQVSVLTRGIDWSCLFLVVHGVAQPYMNGNVYIQLTVVAAANSQPHRFQVTMLKSTLASENSSVV